MGNGGRKGGRRDKMDNTWFLLLTAMLFIFFMNWKAASMKNPINECGTVLMLILQSGSWFPPELHPCLQ